MYAHLPRAALHQEGMRLTRGMETSMHTESAALGCERFIKQYVTGIIMAEDGHLKRQSNTRFFFFFLLCFERVRLRLFQT